MSYLWLIRGYPEGGLERLFIIYNGILKTAYQNAVSNWDGTYDKSWLYHRRTNMVAFTVKLSEISTGLNIKHTNKSGASAVGPRPCGNSDVVRL